MLLAVRDERFGFFRGQADRGHNVLRFGLVHVDFRRVFFFAEVLAM